MKSTLKSSQSLHDIKNMNSYVYLKKVVHDLSNLLPMAEEGFIELNQCQVNNSWLEATCYIYPWLLPYKKGTLAGFGDLLNQVFESAFIIGLVKNGPNMPKLGVPWSVGFTFSDLCTQKTADWYFSGCPLMLNFLKKAYISLNGYFS